MIRYITILLLWMVSLLQRANGQSANGNVSIVRQIIARENDTCTLVYANTINQFFIKKIKKAISKKELCGYDRREKHCITLMSEEKAHILSEFEKFAMPYWGDGLFPNSKLISIDTSSGIPTRLDSLFLKQIKFKQPFLQVKQFTAPIFFHNNKLFIMQIIELWILPKLRKVQAISDDLSIYRKKKGKWVKWLLIDGGISDF